MTAPQSVDIALNIPDCGVSTASSSHGAVKTFPLLIQYLCRLEEWRFAVSKLPEMKSIPNE